MNETPLKILNWLLLIWKQVLFIQFRKINIIHKNFALFWKKWTSLFLSPYWFVSTQNISRLILIYCRTVRTLHENVCLFVYLALIAIICLFLPIAIKRCAKAWKNWFPSGFLDWFRFGFEIFQSLSFILNFVLLFLLWSFFLILLFAEIFDYFLVM